MKIKIILYSSIFFLFVLNGFSQKIKVASADKKYERYAFIDAISIYERIAAKGYKDEKMFQRLANSYYFNGELVKAFKWYDALFSLNSKQEPEYCFKYALCLKSVGDYKKADTIMNQFTLTTSSDKRAQLFTSHRNYLEEIEANSGRFNIANAGINSEFSDYGTAFYDNKLIFCSARGNGGFYDTKFKWTGQSFTDLFSAEVTSNGNLRKPVLFGGSKINLKFNESTPVFTKDGKTMYFTRNNFLDGKRGIDANGITLVKLYKSTIEGDSWVNVTELPFDSDMYSVGHPALSPDGKILYFVSDMPGTIGQSDLYKVSINDDGSYGVPSNLGNRINTEGRESFPFISDDNVLYFASDGHPGLGGLDIFASTINKDGSFADVLNVGAPVNDRMNDFAFFIDSKSHNGFFTSNRPSSMGSEDIYKFSETRKLNCEQYLTGIITDAESGKVLPLAKISVLDTNFKLINEMLADYDGKYRFEVECSKKYYVRAEKSDYQTAEDNIIIGKIAGQTFLSLELDKSIKKIVTGGNLAKAFQIKTIYFDIDKYSITPPAAIDLEKILLVLKDNPKIKIDIRSYTDSRQSAKYNLGLSSNRAKATIDWFIKNGINKNRLSGKGYGEVQLVNGCVDGVLCSEQEHQANRRSEFIVVD